MFQLEAHLHITLVLYWLKLLVKTTVHAITTNTTETALTIINMQV